MPGTDQLEHPRNGPWWRCRWWPAAAAALALAVLLAAVLTQGDDLKHPAPAVVAHPDAASDAPVEPVVPATPVSDVELAGLPAATTFTTLPQAPLDPAPQQPPTGQVLHPLRTVPLYTAPGAPAFAALPITQLVSDTWVPVIAEQPGWAQVLLPSRPNGTTGWVVVDEHVTVASTPYRIVVDRAAFQLSLYRNEVPVGSWRVGVGLPRSPTPPGRTFLLASIAETQPTFSAVILPLGLHSDIYTSYSGGPGTVGIHTWPSAEVYGTASSDGCIRVPPGALQLISIEVPLGSPVVVR